MKNEKRFCWPVRPVALNENILQGKHYRFTVLTSRMIRMEYDPQGQFEDRASQHVFYRDFPVCAFDSRVEEGILTLETEHLLLTYRVDAPFASDTLSLKLKTEPASCWNYGETYEDLGGTVKTLDTVDGPIVLERGLCSRWGFAVMNDSDSLVLNDEGWVEVRSENTADVYFFGYGYDYRGCIRDFYRLTGAPSMLPDYALGNWWSRYHAYTQEEYLELIHRFEKEDVPFSVGVVDMDWHLVDVDVPSPVPRDLNGWTGYTWNEELFPDYKAFLRELHGSNLKTALNLHPAAGVRHHEAMYEEMAKAAGIDPATKEPVPLDILSPKHMADYFDIIHHPYEEDGVDFWWMDWQQGTNYCWIHEANQPGEYLDPRERMDPLWMLNHLHILDISRDGKRPMFFSRYAGPGSHRYPVGFSGDTHITWDSLDFQPYFTATASNIGYGWWSHDIGGHMCGYCDNELQTRWLQFGVFSPINRLHSSNSPWVQKEPWAYDAKTEAIMKKWLRLRHQMFPYIYTMNHRCHTELSPLVQPMYYSHPKCAAAYENRNQYWFGTELVVAPITEANDPVSHTGRTQVWLPDGDWFDFANGLRYAGMGGRTMEVHRPLEQMPVFAKAGAIVPMASHVSGSNTLGKAENMEILVFPGADNSFTLYEDSGDGQEYTNGGWAKTEMSLRWGENALFTVNGAVGDLSLIPAQRSWKIHLRGFHKNVKLCVSVNGEAVEAKTGWDGNTNTHCVCVGAPVNAKIEVSISGEELLHDNADAMQRCFALVRNAQIPYHEKEQIWGILADDSRSAGWKIYHFSGRNPIRRSLDWALRELLTLTEEQHPGQKTMWG